MKLSIPIPVYNFAEFLPETLNSILSQDVADQVEILVVDGASTDSTPELMRDLCAQNVNLRYYRLPEKGGIDRDMARCMELAGTEYCWLFSGDDIMAPGALRAVLTEIESGHDVYLLKHMECFKDMRPLMEYPVLEPDVARAFELSEASQRLDYFKRALNSEAFFSFMGGLVVKRATWNRGRLNPDFIGSCWAHAARLFELMKTGLTVGYTAAVRLHRRGENDSFSDNGLVRRYQIQVEGFHKMVDTFFGHDSAEAREVRRAVRNEFSRRVVLILKVRCHDTPSLENKQLLDHLVKIGYSDFSLRDGITKLLYQWLPIRFCRRYYC
ncbi:MAG: glycosyltransferase family 2 protein [Methylobacteriaceae bacterium]|nr:glycosyltransferase family 2 protein [Methylobacteriaceae bacterium]